MNYAIEALADSYCGPDFKETIASAIDIVSQFDTDELEQELIILAMNCEMYDSMDVPDMVYIKIHEYMDFVLRSHEIVLSEEASISEKIVIADGVLKMQDWLDHSSIIRITECSDSAEEKFADLIFLTETVSAVNILSIIESVPDTFIRRVSEIHKQKEKESSDDEGTDAEYLYTLKALRKYLKDVQGEDDQKVIAFDLLKHGYNLNMPFSIYHSAVAHRLETEDVRYLCIQYLALFHMGVDTWNQILIAWRQKSEHLIESIGLITKVDVQLNKLLVDFDKWKQTNQKELKAL